VADGVVIFSFSWLLHSLCLRLIKIWCHIQHTVKLAKSKGKAAAAHVLWYG